MSLGSVPHVGQFQRRTGSANIAIESYCGSRSSKASISDACFATLEPDGETLITRSFEDIDSIEVNDSGEIKLQQYTDDWEGEQQLSEESDRAGWEA